MSEDQLPAHITKNEILKAIKEYGLRDLEYKVAYSFVTSNLDKKGIAAVHGTTQHKVTRILNKPNVQAYIQELQATLTSHALNKAMALNDAILDKAGQAMLTRFEQFDEEDEKEFNNRIMHLSPSERIQEKKKFAHWTPLTDLDKVIHNAFMRKIKLSELSAGQESETQDQFAERVRARATRKFIERRSQDIELQKKGVDPMTMFSMDVLEVDQDGCVVGFVQQETTENPPPANTVEYEIEESFEIEIERMKVQQSKQSEVNDDDYDW